MADENFDQVFEALEHHNAILMASLSTNRMFQVSRCDRCRYFVNPGQYIQSDYGFTFQKDSPLTQIFDFYIRRIIEIGLLNQLKDTYFVDSTKDFQCSPETSANIFNTVFCFALLAVGGCTAFTILFFEILVKRKLLKI
jgi:hypothetical protein